MVNAEIQDQPSDQVLIRCVEEATIINYVVHAPRGADWQQSTGALADRLNALESQGAIDALLPFRDKSLDQLSSSPSYLVVPFLCRLISHGPHSRDVLEVAAAGLALEESIKNDLVVNSARAALKEWLAGHPAGYELSRQLINAALSTHSALKSFIRPALEVLDEIDYCLELTRSEQSDVSLSAIRALSSLTLKSEEEGTKVFKAMEEAFERSRDDLVGANVLVTAHELAGKESARKEFMTPLAVAICSSAGPQTTHQSASLLFRCADEIDGEFRDLLLRSCMGVNESSAGTINILDLALSELIQRDYKLVVHFIRDLALANSRIDPKSFVNTLQIISRSSDSDFGYAAFSWLRTGSMRLGLALSGVSSGDSIEGRTANIPAELLQLPHEEIVSIARRIVGYFFVHPVSAATLLASIMASTEKVIPELSDLMTDVLLENYGGVRDVLDKLLPDHEAREQLSSCLAKNKDWLDAVSKVPRALDFAPSEKHRLAQAISVNSRMTKANKAAERNSPLFELIPRSIVLNGNEMLSLVDDQTEKLRAVRAPMQKIGFSYESPRVGSLDPTLLNLIYRSLISEGSIE